jgi:N-acetylglucosamine kinase-like BadF-type ATPase
MAIGEDSANAHGGPTPVEWLAGVDGGGTRTRAAVAHACPHNRPRIVGQGEGGPGNPCRVGVDEAGRNIRHAIERAFHAAQIPITPVAALCLGLAGTGRELLRAQMENWARDQRLAERVRVVHDAELVLWAGTDQGTGQGIGLALIAGTGSFCYGRNAAGVTARVGGWGPLLGDEGSGYAIAVAALQAVVRAADRRSPPTVLTEWLLRELDARSPSDLIPVLDMHGPDRADSHRLAALTPIVLRAAAEGDPTARAIRAQAAKELADLVLDLARNLNMAPGHYALAVAGGLLIHDGPLRQAMSDRLEAAQYAPQRLAVVPEPVRGALLLAQQLVGP